jgi:CubicO group peptidase (beta-lactamase class C family)
LGRFVKEEIADPLGISDLWIGIPDQVEPRVARLRNDSLAVPEEHLPPLFKVSMPQAVGLVPEVFEQPRVRRAEVPGVGGIFNARSEARFFAMLAHGGELDGVRLLSEKLVDTLNTPRTNADEQDPVMFGIPIPLSVGGFWLGGDYPPVCSVRRRQSICHPGAGGSIGWADRELELAVAICHNRMFDASSVENDPVQPVAGSIWQALGL